MCITQHMEDIVIRADGHYDKRNIHNGVEVLEVSILPIKFQIMVCEYCNDSEEYTCNEKKLSSQDQRIQVYEWMCRVQT